MLPKWRGAILLAFAALAVACGVARAAAPTPAVLLGVESFQSAPSAEIYAGASVFADDSPGAAPETENFEVRWWMNPAQMDKAGIVLLFSCTREDYPDLVADTLLPLSPRLQGNQTTLVRLPPDGGRVVAWRAMLLQRGKPLSLLKSPDWSATP